jgi:hypothetical protein
MAFKLQKCIRGCSTRGKMELDHGSIFCTYAKAYGRWGSLVRLGKQARYASAAQRLSLSR